MPGLLIRAARSADFDEVLALVTAQNLADYGDVGPSAEQMRARWREMDLAAGTAVARDAGGRLLGYVELAGCGTQSCAVSLYLAGGEACEAAGAALLRHAEARAIVAAGQTLPKLSATVGEGHGARPRLFERAGYRRELTFLQMAIVLDQPPVAPDWPPGVAVRPFVSGQDEWAAYEADEEASADKGYHAPQRFEAWARRMGLHGERFDPALWFLAWAGDEVAGLALNWLDAAASTGWIDHLGVRRAWRRRGLGLALMLHSFDAFYRRGVRRVRLNVDAASPTNAPRLYERAGTRTERRYHVYVKMPAVGPAQEPAPLARP